MSKWLKTYIVCEKKCSPNNLVFSDLSFMTIAEVTENECVIERQVRDIDALRALTATTDRPSPVLSI